MVKAIVNHENLCMKCLKLKDSVRLYSIYGRGYGSDFDSFNTELRLCAECDNPNIELWFNENPIMSDYIEVYEYEEEIHKLTDSLPLQGQELFENTIAYGASANYRMDAQDWIDMKLGILADEKYEEYGMYSPSQIEAYEERFPTCENPVNVIYDDNSKGCWCPFGAYGEYGQSAGYNISDKCRDCEHFKVRENPIKEMDNNTYRKYEQYIKGIQFKNLFE